MAFVGHKEKWNKVYEVWRHMAFGPLRNDVQASYSKYYNRGELAEDAMELALIEHGVLPPHSVMENGADEYDEIQQGADIWASIQKNSAT